MHKNYPTTDHHQTINSEKGSLCNSTGGQWSFIFPTIMLQYQSKGKSTRQPLEAQFPALTDGRERKAKKTKANILLEQAVTPQIPFH